MQPFFTNDAVVLGVLMSLLALVFYTASLDHKIWKRFYTIVPTVLLCYFLPALMHWPLGLIAPAWFDNSLVEFLQTQESALRGLDPKPVLLERSNAAFAIASHLRDSGSDLVVLGTRGRTGMKALLLGTTAERVLHESPCSVLAVKPSETL